MGLLVPSSGRSLEVYGDIHPRWMITAVFTVQNSAYRLTLFLLQELFYAKVRR